MVNLVGRHRGRSKVRRDALLKLDEIEREAAAPAGRAREEHLHRLTNPKFDPRRSCDHQRALAPRELAVKHHERDAPEVVAMEVRHDDKTDRSRVHSGSLEPDQGRCAAINEELLGPVPQVYAALKPTAAPECVANPYERNGHHLRHRRHITKHLAQRQQVRAQRPAAGSGSAVGRSHSLEVRERGANRCGVG